MMPRTVMGKRSSRFDQHRPTAHEIGDGQSQEVAAPQLTVSEADAARYLNMSQAWLKKSRTAKFRSVIDAPPFIRCGGRRVAYRIQDLDAWQERHRENVGPGRRSNELPTVENAESD